MHAVGAHGAHQIDAVLDQEGDIAFLRRRPQPLGGGADRGVIEAGRRAQQQTGDVPRRDRLAKRCCKALAVPFAGQARGREVEPRRGRRQETTRGRALAAALEDADDLLEHLQRIFAFPLETVAADDEAVAAALVDLPGLAEDAVEVLGGAA